MRYLWILSVTALCTALPADAAKTNLETGETCFGVGCADEPVDVPDIDPSSNDEDADQPVVSNLCEDIAERVYELCTRTPGSDTRICLAERDDALDRCENPQDHVDEGPGDTATLGPTSDGIYRIPYADGTKVKVSRDYFDHHPPGKIDMHGKGGGTHEIVAAADGTIRIIEDSRSKSQHPWDSLRKGPCKNNFVWIEHDNGEWSKYSHMLQNTTKGKAGLSVGDGVIEGTYLGDEGKVGCAEPAHLHFEVALPSQAARDSFDPDNPGVYFELQGGGLRSNTNRSRNRNPRICGIESQTFQDGESYEAVTGPGIVSSGDDEVIRHGMPVHNYHCFVRRGIKAGYRTAWVDFFELDRDQYVNVVMHPKTGDWASRTGLDADAFLAENRVLKEVGYRLSHLDSYERDGTRYAGIWEKRSQPAQQLYLDKTLSAHEAEVDRLKALGFRPRAISVISDGGLRYAAIWEQVTGGWSLRSRLTIAEYREHARSMSDDGKEVVFLNAYAHGGETYIAAIWHAETLGDTRRRTDIGKKEFDTEWSIARKLGMKTTAVTAHDADGSGHYSAVFKE